MNQKDYKAIGEIISSVRIKCMHIEEVVNKLADHFEKEEQNNIKTNHPLWLDKEVLKGAKEIREQFLKDCGVKQ